MVTEYTIERVEPDSPWRCQASLPKGQCLNMATALGGTCACHGGNMALNSAEKKSLNNYRLTKFNAQLKRHSESPKLKTLGDEVAILRMILEEKLNLCQDSHDLALNSHIISDLVVKIEKLVKSCHSLESSLGGMLDKQAILTFASKVIEIISSNIQDEAILDAISAGILGLVGEVGKKELE